MFIVGKQEKFLCNTLKFQNCAYVLNNSSIFSKRISIHKLCPQSVSIHSVVHFQGIAKKVFFSKMRLSKYAENEP